MTRRRQIPWIYQYSRLLIGITAILGICVTAYLTWVKLSNNGACGTESCQIVLTSPFANVGNLPLTGLGLLSYVGVAAMAFAPTLINPKTNKAIARINSVTGRDIVALASDKKGELWIGMRDGLVLANTDNGAITASIYNLPSSSIINLLVRDQQVWIGTESGLGKINTKLKKTDIPSANATVVYK